MCPKLKLKGFGEAAEEKQPYKPWYMYTSGLQFFVDWCFIFDRILADMAKIHSLVFQLPVTGA